MITELLLTYFLCTNQLFLLLIFLSCRNADARKHARKIQKSIDILHQFINITRYIAIMHPRYCQYSFVLTVLLIILDFNCTASCRRKTDATTVIDLLEIYHTICSIVFYRIFQFPLDLLLHHLTQCRFLKLIFTMRY